MTVNGYTYIKEERKTIVLEKFILSEDVLSILKECKKVIIPKTRQELVDMALGSKDADEFEVAYDVNGKMVTEANVVRCKNGVSVNYLEDYMRRRDPNCTIIADNEPTDKPRYEDVYGETFDGLRQETFEWLKSQELLVVPFMSGGREYGYESLLIAPVNAAFFACAIADLQFFLDLDQWEGDFKPRAIFYLAPPFRHTKFNGKQIVAHNRTPEVHELFAYNLYPGPSAKKGSYGVLLNIGEQEGWLTAHASAVKIVTPYDNELVIMHEGASGGGKSEMLESIPRDSHGKIVVGQNLASGEKFYIDIQESCVLKPVTDDMALCHPKLQNGSKKLVVTDAEDAWFLRLDNITSYGSEPMYERICTQPSEPLIFLNLDGVPKSTCLIWEHTKDSDGKPCPNPRVVLPRRMIPNIINEGVEVDVRSFGVRVPPCTKEKPTYGILGMLHILPPALAWLWRLVAPRGYNNPSVIDSKGMTSEGVGSYWPFATGLRVKQANLLLEQIMDSSNTRYVLIPNQHIGVYKVGFMAEWLSREYIARRSSAKFRAENLVKARCPILGYAMDNLKIDGQYVRKAFLQPETQKEVGNEGYDAGAKILTDFFKEELKQYNVPELHPIGRKIIECCLNDGTIEDYEEILPMKY